MEFFWVFLKGLAIGVAVAAPVGPVGILCVQRTLHDGLPHGLATGFGAATADTLFSAIAGLGLASVAAELMHQEALLRLGGAGVLAVLAVRTWLRPLPAAGPEPSPERLARDYTSGLFVTLSNPMTILGIVGIFAAFGLEELALGRGLALLAGVALGSGLWWLGLCGGAALFRGRLGHGGIRWLNRVAAMLLAGFAGVALIAAFA